MAAVDKGQMQVYVYRAGTGNNFEWEVSGAQSIALLTEPPWVRVSHPRVSHPEPAALCHSLSVHQSLACQSTERKSSIHFSWLVCHM